MDLFHCEELVVGLADKLAYVYPLGRPPAETIDEVQRLSTEFARAYVRSIGGDRDDIESIAASMMRKFNHRYGWLTETTSMRILQRDEPQGCA